jgi:hypothetical protein
MLRGLAGSSALAAGQLTTDDASGGPGRLRLVGRKKQHRERRLVQKWTPPRGTSRRGRHVPPASRPSPHPNVWTGIIIQNAPRRRHAHGEEAPIDRRRGGVLLKRRRPDPVGTGPAARTQHGGTVVSPLGTCDARGTCQSASPCERDSRSLESSFAAYGLSRYATAASTNCNIQE